MSYARTSRGNRIACMFVRCSPNARYTLLHSHGNAVDLGQMSSFYMGLGSRINCNIFSYDYSGENFFAKLSVQSHSWRVHFATDRDRRDSLSISFCSSLQAGNITLTEFGIHHWIGQFYLGLNPKR